MTYRRVSRPSSPLTAKASTKRPSRAWFDPEKVRLFLNQKSSFWDLDLITQTQLWSFALTQTIHWTHVTHYCVTHIPSYQLTLVTWWSVKIIYRNLAHFLNGRQTWLSDESLGLLGRWLNTFNHGLVSVFWLGKTVNLNDISLSHTHWRVIADNTRLRTLVGLQNCDYSLRNVLLTY